MNKIILIGNLGKAPESKMSKTGNTYTTFSVATADGFGDNKKTNWHNCTAFGKNADNIYNYFSGGDKIAIEGSIDYNKTDKGIYTSVLVDRFHFVGKREKKKEQGNLDIKTNADFTSDSIPF